MQSDVYAGVTWSSSHHPVGTGGWDLAPRELTYVCLLSDFARPSLCNDISLIATSYQVCGTCHEEVRENENVMSAQH